MKGSGVEGHGGSVPGGGLLGLGRGEKSNRGRASRIVTLRPACACAALPVSVWLR